VPGALLDPTLELHDGNGATLATNDNWQEDARAAELAADKFQPSDTRESALLRSLPPGAYTAIIAGAGGKTGVALVEVYDID
jgi:hypothetical protein